MPNRVPWTERTFNFDFPADLHPELMERLRGTPARTEEIAATLAPEVLTRRDGDTWSIQENIGHLADTESLFTGRLDEIEAGAATLTAADMTNSKTHDANHNDRTIDSVLTELCGRREMLVARLETLAPESFARAALHPRLNRPMRVVDMMLFHAEHDDYHLARIRQLVGLFAQP